MIPKQVISLMGGICVMHAASRDAELRPCIANATGPIEVEDGDILTFFLAGSYAPKLLEHYGANRRVALVAAHPESFETYQLKGEFIESRNYSAEDQGEVETVLSRLADHFVQLGYPEDMVQGYMGHYTHCIAVRFKVEQVFEQAPKPGTGNPITGS